MAQNITNIDNLPDTNTTNSVPVQQINSSQAPQVQQQQQAQPQQPQQQQAQPQQFTQVSDDIVQQIVSGLKNAEQQGLTSIPSNIQNSNTQQFTHDEQIQPNYIPPPKPINPQQENMNIEEIHKVAQKQLRQQKQTNFVQQIQTPLIVSVFIMLSHLPIIQRIIFKHFPALYHKQGSLNMYGLLFISIIFSGFYFVGNRVIEIFNEE